MLVYVLQEAWQQLFRQALHSTCRDGSGAQLSTGTADCRLCYTQGFRPAFGAKLSDECSQSISSLVASLLCFPGDLKASVPG